MTRIDEFWSFSYIISMNRLKNVYDVDLIEIIKKTIDDINQPGCLIQDDEDFIV